MIAFDRCDNKTSTVTCKSEEQITDWLEAKYFLAIMNYKQFVQDKFYNERILSKAQSYWYPINTLTRTDYVSHITRTTIVLNDHQLNIGEFLTVEEKGFFTERQPNRELPYKNNF